MHRRRHIIFRGQWVGSGKGQVGAAGDQGAAEVGGLGRHVQTGGDPRAGEGLSTRKLRSDRREDRHPALGEGDLAAAPSCQPWVAQHGIHSGTSSMGSAREPKQLTSRAFLELEGSEA